MGTPKKKAVNLPVGSNTKRKAKKPITASKKAAKPRFFEIKVRINADEYARGQPYFKELKYLSRFVLDAYQEKVNRAEANDKAARLRILSGNIDLIVPLLKEACARGDLNFLREIING